MNKQHIFDTSISGGSLASDRSGDPFLEIKLPREVVSTIPIGTRAKLLVEQCDIDAVAKVAQAPSILTAFKISSLEEIEAEARRHELEMERCFTHDVENGYLTLQIDGSRYDIELKRLPDQESLLAWLRHLLRKNWFKAEHAGELIDRVCGIKGWDLKDC